MAALSVDSKLTKLTNTRNQQCKRYPVTKFLWLMILILSQRFPPAIRCGAHHEHHATCESRICDLITHRSFDVGKHAAE